MDVSKPIAAALFIYECIRLLLLATFLSIASSMGNGISFGGAGGAFFPYIVYISSNALFPLMALFVWLRPREYRNYVTLYIAGKVITVVLFYLWAISFSRGLPQGENMAGNITLWGSSIIMNMADILSIWGAWALKKNYRKAESGGL